MKDVSCKVFDQIKTWNKVQLDSFVPFFKIKRQGMGKKTGDDDMSSDDEGAPKVGILQISVQIRRMAKIRPLESDRGPLAVATFMHAQDTVITTKVATKPRAVGPAPPGPMERLIVKDLTKMQRKQKI